MRDRERHEVAPATHDQDMHVEHEAPAQERYVHGEVPPVQTAAADPGRSASQLAFEEDDNVRELKTKVGGLVTKKFGGDYKKAFDHYDADKNGTVDKHELVQLLADAGVGNGITRGAWASKIIEKLDQDGDTAIAWGEFQTVFTAAA